MAQKNMEPAEVQMELHASEMGEEGGGTKDHKGQSSAAEGMHGSGNADAQRRYAPRPGSFVPPHVLRALANSEANSDRERAAAQRTLDFDIHRKTTRQHSEEDDQGEDRDRGDVSDDATKASLAASGKRE
ncbi:uncharacterized protein ColSpa_09676 [Colletotrichum spaethianum]|uniref:Uncharacterized protein n=1 Tax=Colletotrichum spaethianum TaxID=700344 RepID=A0AA37PC77_9PEZI|nr:uncharacterized protein ColSpa_09676 [Colletotrichum spaethianum]GKT49495.1 hypothetical protein ColSpa_09676 [Colletotrichum spaethianum]